MTIDDQKINCANPQDRDLGTLFRVWFGEGYGAPTCCYVWTSGDAPDDAFEQAVDWLDDEGIVGYFVSLDEGNMKDAAESEGLMWPGLADFDPCGDDDHARILSAAETDLTIIGHTTLSSATVDIIGGGPHYVPSEQWGLDEIDSDSDEWRAVYHECLPGITAQQMSFCRAFKAGFWFARQAMRDCAPVKLPGWYDATATELGACCAIALPLVHCWVEALQCLREKATRGPWASVPGYSVLGI